MSPPFLAKCSLVTVWNKKMSFKKSFYFTCLTRHLYGLLLVRLSRLPSRLSSPKRLSSSLSDPLLSFLIVFVLSITLIFIFLTWERKKLRISQENFIIINIASDNFCMVSQCSLGFKYQQQSFPHVHLTGRFPKRPALVLLLRSVGHLLHLFLLSRPVHSILYSLKAPLHFPTLLCWTSFVWCASNNTKQGQIQLRGYDESFDSNQTLTPLQGAKATSKTQCCANSWKCYKITKTS